MGRSKKYKSPSTTKRSLRRLIGFLRRRIRVLKPLTICHQDSVSIPSLSRNLSLYHASSIDVQPAPGAAYNLIKPRPPSSRPKLEINIATNTCDSPECYGRKRPCHALNPRTQFYHDDCYLDFRWWLFKFCGIPGCHKQNACSALLCTLFVLLATRVNKCE